MKQLISNKNCLPTIQILSIQVILVTSEARNPKLMYMLMKSALNPYNKNTQISQYIPVTIATTCVQIIKYKMHFWTTVGIILVSNNHESLAFLTHDSLQLANFIEPP